MTTPVNNKLLVFSPFLDEIVMSKTMDNMLATKPQSMNNHKGKIKPLAIINNCIKAEAPEIPRI